jgi:hypothetical protein
MFFKAAIFCIKHHGGQGDKTGSGKRDSACQMVKKLFGIIWEIAASWRSSSWSKKKDRPPSIFSPTRGCHRAETDVRRPQGVVDTILKTFYQEIEKYLQVEFSFCVKIYQYIEYYTVAKISK